jgi:sodium-dependent dicarboxylate transporter 2/3/5
VCLLSELGSNTATATLVLPLLASAAQGWGMDPQRILWPATFAASLGFMLPVASPMQTIVFSTGRIPVRHMVRAGMWMDLIGVLLLMLVFGWR